jgi:CheY-like chemotaxis protein
VVRAHKFKAQFIATEQLTARRMQVKAVATAEDALAEMRRAAKESEPYHMAVIDYMMPGMDGLDLASVILQEEALKRTLMLMVTSAPSRGDNARMQEAGFSGFLCKPVNGVDIALALAVIWGAHKKGKTIPLVTRHTLREDQSRQLQVKFDIHHFDGAQILLAEDNAINQMVATTLLEKLGCHVTPAADGEEAVKLIKQRRFHLIFMDCQMPEMDGFEATNVIRLFEKQHSLSRTPIVAFTANAMKGDEERCLNAGMDDYISKPVKPEELERVLGKWLKQRTSLAATLGDAAPELQILNLDILQQLREMVGGPFDGVLTNYEESCAAQLELVRAAAAKLPAFDIVCSRVRASGVSTSRALCMIGRS